MTRDCDNIPENVPQHSSTITPNSRKTSCLPTTTRKAHKHNPSCVWPFRNSLNKSFFHKKSCTSTVSATVNLRNHTQRRAEVVSKQHTMKAELADQRTAPPLSELRHTWKRQKAKVFDISEIGGGLFLLIYSKNQIYKLLSAVSPKPYACSVCLFVFSALTDVGNNPELYPKFCMWSEHIFKTQY